MNLPVLIIIIPFLMGILSPLLGLYSRNLVFALGISAFLSLLGASGYLCHEIYLTDVNSIEVLLGNWPPPWGIQIVADRLNSIFTFLLAFIGTLSYFFSRFYFDQRPAKVFGFFSALFFLLTAGLLGILLTADFFNLYVFIEIASLSAYTLISFGGKNAAYASFRYLLLGTIGASLYLMGLGFLYSQTGSLNFTDTIEFLKLAPATPALTTALVFFLMAFTLKMGLFPMHGWLPDAYSYAPAPVSAFISGIMGKVNLYLLLRFFLQLFPTLEATPLVFEVLRVMAIGAVFFGGILAIAQNNLRRMLAFSSMAQMGLLVLALEMRSEAALIGMIFFVLSHGIMKSNLFLLTGGMRLKMGIINRDDIRGLAYHMPFTSVAFLIAALSMVGVPPTSGFFGKWYIAVAAAFSEDWLALAVVLIGSLLTAIYFFRILEPMFFKKRPRTRGSYRLGWPMLLPIWILTLSILLLGIFNEPIVGTVLQPMVEGVFH